MGADPPNKVAEALRIWLHGFGLPRRTLVSDNNGFDAMSLNCFTDKEAILARTLGISVNSAVRWQQISAGDWTGYAADISARTSAKADNT